METPTTLMQNIPLSLPRNYQSIAADCLQRNSPSQRLRRIASELSRLLARHPDRNGDRDAVAALYDEVCDRLHRAKHAKAVR